MTFAYCEPVVAGPLAPWCLRVLDGEGLKLTGGVTTPSLCGRVRVHYGWDLSVPYDPKRERGVCSRCLALARTTEKGTTDHDR